MALKESDTILSEAEYLKGELESDVKHEYINGYVYAMAGASKQHNRLTSTISGEFRNHLKGKPCDAYASDFKVKRGTKYFYPDVVVECDSEDDHEDYTDHPMIIVEVTSETTHKFDRTYKLEAYQSIPSLQEYVIVEQSQAMVDVHKRVEDGWDYTRYTLGDSVHFESMGLRLSVAEIYERVDNEDMRAYLKIKGNLISSQTEQRS